MSLLCTYCNTNTLHNDSQLGLIFCTSCGNISSESIPTSSLTFSKTATDTQLNGQLISLSTNTVFFNTRIQDVLETLCINMSLPLSYGQMSYRWYRLALQHNLSKGKALLYTLSACVYITCRIEHLPVMIVDFSACLRISASGIGRMYKKLCKVLGVKINMNDPSFYIPKYISQLKLDKANEEENDESDIKDSSEKHENEELDSCKDSQNNHNDNEVEDTADLDKENVRNIEQGTKNDAQKKNVEFDIKKNYSVTYLANRIVRWMNRDWISAGRRPNNVCGAAILVASRIYGAEKSIEEVARIVKGGVNTIQKRLKEIGDTATAEMTVEKFVHVWIEREEDPPLEKKRMKKMLMENEKNKQKLRSIKTENGKIHCTEDKNNINVMSGKINIDDVSSYMKNTTNKWQGTKDTESPSEIIEDCYKSKNIIEQHNSTDFLYESEDSEINDCLLSDNEVEKREDIWNEMYEDYMKEKENKPVVKAKRKMEPKKAVEKKKSCKLNYSVLQNFFV